MQGIAPKMCCACGSRRIGRAPSVELARNFAEKRTELESVCAKLNELYSGYVDLKTRYDAIMDYWKQQRRRGYITHEEYEALAKLFEGARQEKNKEEKENGKDT